MSGVERTRIDTERNFLDVLDKVQEISGETVDPTHVFTLSQVYEGLLLKMGEKGNDGGQFFTPRQVIRAMVQVVDPEDRPGGLRPRLRHRRIPGAELRVHARSGWARRSRPTNWKPSSNGRSSGARKRT